MSTQPSITIDARIVPPRERHGLILRTFDELAPGETFLLVNDHLPRPLYYEFMHERTDQFTWEYLQDGPEEWRVLIGRKAAQ